MNVFVVTRVHGGPQADDCDMVCGVFQNLDDAKACLAHEYSLVRPEDKWIFSEDPPGNNNGMWAEIVQTDDEFDRFKLTEKEIQ